MLVIKDVNYQKNYFTFQVLDKGTYLVAGTLIEADVGNYQMHLPYEKIRNMIPKEIPPIVLKSDNEIYLDDDLKEAVGKEEPLVKEKTSKKGTSKPDSKKKTQKKVQKPKSKKSA